MLARVRKFSRRALLATAVLAVAGTAALLIFGCATTTPGVAVQPINHTYKYYLNNKDDINANRVVAALSYSASLVSNNKVYSWAELNRLLKLYEGQLYSGNLSPNYPEQLTDKEALIFTRFISSWCKSHKDRVPIRDAQSKYVGDANNLIFRIINNEYHR